MEWETIVVIAWVFLLVLTVRTIWGLQSAKRNIDMMVDIAIRQNDVLTKLAHIVDRMRKEK